MVIPVHDRNPTRRFPVVTSAILVVCFAVFLLEPVALPSLGDTSAAAVCEQTGFFLEHGAVPEELLSGEQLDTTAGPAVAGGCAAVPPDFEKSPLLSAVGSLFLHGGWLHLLGNMLFLWVFGNNVEDRFGRLRFLVFYLATGVLATYAFALSDASSTAPVVGASGAIAGVLGAYLVLFPRAWVVSLVPFLFFLPVPLRAWLVLGTWFLLQGVYWSGARLAAGSSVAYLAHVVGFALGAGLVWGLQRVLGRPLAVPGGRRRRAA